MKKLFVLALALVMVLALGTTVFAAKEITAAAGSATSGNVTGTYNAGTPGAPVYCVDVTWEGLAFTYHGQTDGTWNPDSHSYGGTIEAGWDDQSATITVTNHSNVDVTATASFNKAADTDYAMTFTGNDVTVGNALGGSAQTKTITGKMSAGTLTTGDNAKVLGTITLTIS